LQQQHSSGLDLGEGCPSARQEMLERFKDAKLSLISSKSKSITRKRRAIWQQIKLNKVIT
jgi:hypothetical protein